MQQQQQERDEANDHQEMNMKPVIQQQKEKCPRCESFNTKFCYYNNYSLSQPRYFCKSCRRYWTHGGTLRNVPIGGASRKGKRPKTTTTSSSSSPSPSPSSATLSQPSPEIQHQHTKLISSTDPGAIPLSVSASTGAGFGYLAYPPHIFNHSDDVTGILHPAAGYSFGSEQNWVHQNQNISNVSDASMWTINDTTISSAGNSSRITNNSNTGNSLIPNPDQWSADGDDLPGYGHPP